MIFVLELLGSPRLNICNDSHYKSDLAAYFASSKKVDQVAVHLVLHFPYVKDHVISNHH